MLPELDRKSSVSVLDDLSWTHRYSYLGSTSEVACADYTSPQSIWKISTAKRSLQSPRERNETWLKRSKSQSSLGEYVEDERIDFVSDLPGEIVSSILLRLDNTSLAQAAQVSKAWNASIRDGLLWRRKCIKDGLWPIPRTRTTSMLSRDGSAGDVTNEGSDSHTGSWRKTYSNRHRIERNWSSGRHKSESFDSSVRALGGGAPSMGFSISRGGDLLARASLDDVFVYNSSTKEQLGSTLEGHTGTVCAVRFSHDNAFLYSASEDDTVRIWRMTDRECIKVLNCRQGGVEDLVVGTDCLFTAGADGSLAQWNRDDLQLLKRIECKAGPAYALTVNRYMVAAGYQDGFIRTWSLKSSQQVQQLAGHDGAVKVVCFNEDGNLVSGSQDGKVIVWRAENACSFDEDAKEFYWYAILFHGSAIMAMQCDRNRIITGAIQGNTKVWSNHTYRLIRTHEFEDGTPVLGLTLDANGFYALTGNVHSVSYDVAIPCTCKQKDVDIAEEEPDYRLLGA
eukprot:Clim_evm58s128 gene=Clim_evmTU58s128